MNSVDTLTPTERASRPVLASPTSGTEPISAARVSDALRRLARLRGEDPSTIVPTSLRMTGITRLANSDIAEKPDLLLRTIGHHHVESSQPYIIPGADAAAAVTNVLQH